MLVLNIPRHYRIPIFLRLLFWTTFGEHPKIQRANYDGTQMKTLITSDLTSPTGLTIDIKSKFQFFGDGSVCAITGSVKIN